MGGLPEPLSRQLECGSAEAEQRLELTSRYQSRLRAVGLVVDVGDPACLEPVVQRPQVAQRGHDRSPARPGPEIEEDKREEPGRRVAPSEVDPFLQLTHATLRLGVGRDGAAGRLYGTRAPTVNYGAGTGTSEWRERVRDLADQLGVRRGDDPRARLQVERGLSSGGSSISSIAKPRSRTISCAAAKSTERDGFRHDDRVGAAGGEVAVRERLRAHHAHAVGERRELARLSCTSCARVASSDMNWM